ncbi:MAG: gfo/Idh/MocA family oxidoreductase, partial [Acidobacteria bacterium]|nr:gfo/Idh/MocA family oxidoreductase [Acidobacteriota bacterium]
MRAVPLLGLGALPARSKGGAVRAPGANDRIQVGVIGVGGRGAYLAREFAAIGERDQSCRVVAVSDVW